MSEIKNLYEVTGNITDINTMLINRKEINELRAALADRDAKLAKFAGLPMKYKRMEFNAALQKENTELRAKLSALEKQKPYGYWWTPDGTYDIGQEPVMSQNTGPCTGWTITPLFAAAGAAPKDAP